MTTTKDNKKTPEENKSGTSIHNIPLELIIGDPLKVCIEAQEKAAQESWEFLQKVGLDTDPKADKKTQHKEE